MNELCRFPVIPVPLKSQTARGPTRFLHQISFDLSFVIHGSHFVPLLFMTESQCKFMYKPRGCMEVSETNKTEEGNLKVFEKRSQVTKRNISVVSFNGIYKISYLHHLFFLQRSLCHIPASFSFHQIIK